MGNCLGKDGPTDGETYQPHNNIQNINTIVPPPADENNLPGNATNCGFNFPTSSNVDKLVLETLQVIGRLVDKYALSFPFFMFPTRLFFHNFIGALLFSWAQNKWFICGNSEQEPPPAMLKLYAIADKEDGWLQVVSSLVNVIPMHNPLGPSVITLLLDDCPLPSKVSTTDSKTTTSFQVAVNIIVRLIISGFGAEALPHVSIIPKNWQGTNERNATEKHLSGSRLHSWQISRSEQHRYPLGRDVGLPCLQSCKKHCSLTRVIVPLRGWL